MLVFGGLMGSSEGVFRVGGKKALELCKMLAGVCLGLLCRAFGEGEEAIVLN